MIEYIKMLLKKYILAQVSLSILLTAGACRDYPTNGNDGPECEPQYQDEIAYISGDWTLTTKNLETGETREVTSPASGGTRWSLDGQRIAYVTPSKVYESCIQIWVVNADGTGKRIVTLWDYQGKIQEHPDGGSTPVWSPEGQRIAFNRFAGASNYEIYIIDLDTTQGVNEFRVTRNPRLDRVSDWSPDGEKLLIQSEFALDSTYDHRGDWYTINVDGSGKQLLLANDSTFIARYLRYSPDGKQIAFLGWEANFPSTDNDREVYLMNADGSDLRRITNDDLKQFLLSWSPDGTRLAFGTYDYYAEEKYGPIYIINIDGTGLQELASGSSSDPDWRPCMRE